MLDYSELKRLAESLIELNRANLMDWAATIEDARIGKTHTEYALAANPAAVLALIADNDSQRQDLQNLRTDNAQLIYALKQEEQSYLALRAERDQLKAENEALKAKAETWCRYGDDDCEHTYYGDKDAIAALTALVFEVEALRKNAERYEWLSAVGGGSWAVIDTGEKATRSIFDECVDAAMGRGEQP